MPDKHGHNHKDLLDVEPNAVPALRGAFISALDQVDRQLELAATEVRVAAWANDPVSQEATEGINALSVDTDTAALEQLRSFRRQLGTAVDTLDKIAEHYRLLEDDNKANVSHTGQG
ncbi:hypothetical protein SAMN05192558_12110 [Actinokineospora alba]|uniref:PE family protein n=1 Tax=Actinokineospora alba TaxID=504798 RepID=A0A1H0WFL8_9PSEU|nr:hypothetical protein [Actinokineospora alba]TDP65288.1 hypothetical protein C8E96_0768 [Actinokineospora alba]SDH58924.1 hypothetical protein SAMN05421871_101590 [Actinokineospora alba]SDP89520.1 hypothetical protein SAMN05192558_12110 [Actinokineospora alba]